jgi:hypothetical protein
MFDCGKNQFTSLDVSKNTTLLYLDCRENFMNATDLNALFETLHSNPGAKSIVVNDNGPNRDGTGAKNCDTSIATNKGWTMFN